jgi:hypothetical protein
MRPWLLSMVLGLSLLGYLLWIATGRHSEVVNKRELFPQNQECQPDVVALHVRFPNRPGTKRAADDAASEPQIRSVTNCRRLGFRYFLNTSELTDRAYWLVPGDSAAKSYALNSNMERDLVVHLSHLQPATSILDPTISTNLNLLALADKLQRARARFDGTRQPLGRYDFDGFSPYRTDSSREFWFLSRQEASPEFVGRCTTPPQSGGTCGVLVYSQQDGLAFELTVPRNELYRLDRIIERSLELIRKWRLPL